MGSDLHMTPPSPDELRIVYNYTQTAIYTRHTDNIYRDGTDTWFRKEVWDDPKGSIRDALALVTGHPVKTVNESTSLDETLPRAVLEEKDRHWESEERMLMDAQARAHARVNSAIVELGEATVRLAAFREEMKKR